MRAFSGLRSSATLPSILLISCLFSGTNGFFPSDWREKYFGNGGVSHEAQTRNAYDALVEKYFPDISPITANMIKARTTMAEANMEVDDDQTSSAKHFDGENFDGGQALLVEAKTNVIAALRDGNGESARKFLGAALHTLQDFYSHTNWVELGRSDINYDLGKAGVRLSLVTFGQQTCSECGFGGLERLLLGCHDCTTNTNGFSLLTSGYYEGEDSPAGDVDIPDWKCRHGGATDSVLGAVAGAIAASTFSDVTPGINKDSLNCFWSPHHFHHSRAVEFATKSSIQYIEDIIAEGALTDAERKILFGVGTTLAFAIDTTGSMASIIAATRQQAIAIARGRLGTKDEPIDYVVAPFNDPTTGPVMRATTIDAFEANVNTLSASGGGDCPELAIRGILDALEVMEGPSDLFVMTDAVAKDYDELASTAITTAFNKKIRFHVFKFDSNCDDGAASKRDGLERRADSTANRQYSLLAASTGGTYHSLPVSEANSISSLLDSVTLSESGAILKLAGDLNATAYFDIPVDSKMTEFTISMRGAGVRLTLAQPDGLSLPGSTSGLTRTEVTDGVFINVKDPAAGKWSLVLELAAGTTSATFACDVTGVSPLHLSKFNFVTLRGRPGHKGYYPITGQPAYDHDVAAVAEIDGVFDEAVFDLRNGLASHVLDTNMEQGTGAEGAPPRNSFYGEMRLRNEPLYAYVEGTDDTGAPFLRVLGSVFQPLLSGTSETGFNSTDIFAGRNTTNITSSSIVPSSTSTILNFTSTSSSFSHTSSSVSIYPTNSANSSHSVYPTSSVSTKSGHYYSGYPVPVYTWEHTEYHPKPTGSVVTHTKYATPGCDSLKPSTYTTTTTCTITDEEPTPYTTVSTITVTTYVPSLCATCTGGNYPHHTGKGPWKEEDKSVVESGYGDYVSTVEYTPYEPYATDKSEYTKGSETKTKDGYAHYTSEPSAYPEEEDEYGYKTATYTAEVTVTKGDYIHYTAEPSVYPEHEEEEYEEKTTTCTDEKTVTKGDSYPTSVEYLHYTEGEYEYEHSTKVEVEHHTEVEAEHYTYTSPPSEYTHEAKPEYEHSTKVEVEYHTEVEAEHYSYSSPASEYTHQVEYSTKIEYHTDVETEHYTSALPSYPVDSASPNVPIYTATVSYPAYSVNGTKSVSVATASEYAPAEFTGGVSRVKASAAVVVGFVGGVLML